MERLPIPVSSVCICDDPAGASSISGHCFMPRSGHMQQPWQLQQQDAMERVRGMLTPSANASANGSLPTQQPVNELWHRGCWKLSSSSLTGWAIITFMVAGAMLGASMVS
jgi:hypothetical protein